MPFEATIQAFAAALGDPRSPAPPTTRGREGRPDGRRFAVYRNNVAVGLIGALEKRYPVTRRLVGEDFFRALAGAFAAANRPGSPVLMLYGADFPAFVDAFEPAREIPFLADVARLENAWVEAYHSAEAAPLDVSDLAAVPPERLGELILVFHPAVRLLRFAHPAASIWAAHQGEGPPRAPGDWRAEDALIVRPQAEVAVRILPPGGYAFASALLSGQPLAEAAAQVGDEGAALHLVGLLEAGAVASFR